MEKMIIKHYRPIRFGISSIYYDKEMPTKLITNTGPDRQPLQREHPSYPIEPKNLDSSQSRERVALYNFNVGKKELLQLIVIISETENFLESCTIEIKMDLAERKVYLYIFIFVNFLFKGNVFKIIIGIPYYFEINLDGKIVMSLLAKTTINQVPSSNKKAASVTDYN